MFVKAVWPRCGVHKGHTQKGKETECCTQHENTQNIKQNLTPTQNHTQVRKHNTGSKTVHRKNSEVHILTWRSGFASFFLFSSSSSPHFPVFPKPFLLHLLPLMLLGWQSTQNTSFHSTFLPPPHVQYITAVFFIHLSVHSCLPPRWNPVFAQSLFVFFSQVQRCSNFAQFLLVFASGWGGVDGEVKDGRSYWEGGKTRDDTRRRQEGQ